MIRATNIGCRLFVILLLSGIFSTVSAVERHPHVTTFEHVEYLVSDERRPPDDDEDWQPIKLPDNWAITRPGFKGRVWYRIRFDVNTNRPKNRAVYIPRNNADHYLLFINYEKRGGNRSHTSPNLTDLHRPLIHGRAGFPPGENVVHIRLDGDATYHHGLSRVTIGPPRVMRPQYYQPRYDLQVTSIAAFGTTLLLAGLLALLVWRNERENPVLFWFAMVALVWSVSIFLMVWPPHIISESMLHLLLYSVRHFYTVPLLVLCMRVAKVHHRRLEVTLWSVFVIGAIVSMMLDAEAYLFFASLSWIFYLTLIFGFFGWLLWRQYKDSNAEMQRADEDPGLLQFKKRKPSSYFLPVMLIVVISFTLHDWARWIGYADYDNLLLTPYAIPFLILAMGATIIERHLVTARALARSNLELEQRVAEKAGELEQAYEQMHLTEREQAVLRERQRIMGDMHDGLTANLVSLHNIVQSNSADSTEVARRLDETLRELRAIIDSLEPVEGDLGVVLGNIRYRMRAAFEESGIKLRWQVEELPVLPDLTPEKILNIQRIVLEVLTNTLRHAAAQTVTVSARAETERNVIIIKIKDDGAGFDLNATSGGHGLGSMYDRASRIDVTLEIQSQPGQGTSVTLEVPITHT